MQPPKVPDDVIQAFRAAEDIAQLFAVGQYMKPYIEEYGKHPLYGAGFLMFARASWDWYRKQLEDNNAKDTHQEGKTAS